MKLILCPSKNWSQFLSIALDDYSARIAPEVIFLCEGSLNGSKRKNFDADIYNTIFGDEFPDISFISGGSCTDLENGDHSGYSLLKETLKSSKIVRLLDRDDKSEQEVTEFANRGFVVLRQRHIESYLFDDEVLKKLVERVAQDTKWEELLEIKTQAVKNAISRGRPTDDVKSASGEIYNGIKKLLSLTQCGNNTEAFMRDTLAPLITTEMLVYKQLKEEIVQPIIEKNIVTTHPQRKIYY